MKTEVCLVEEGKGKEGEELILPVWEEDKKEEEGVRVFRVPREEMKGGGESEYKKVRDLLKDFPNLKVGGLLPDPAVQKEGVVITETTEWTVVVFPRGQGHWRRAICPDASFNKPPLKGDWARHPCCGTICAVRSAPVEETNRHRTLWASPAVKPDGSAFGMLPSFYGQLPELSCFEPKEVAVESPEVKFNKSVNISK